MRRIIPLIPLLSLLFIAGDAPGAAPQPEPTLTPALYLDPALAERLEQGAVRRGEPIDVAVRVLAPPPGASATLFLRAVDGEIRSRFGPPADQPELGASLPAVRIPIDGSLLEGGGPAVRVPFTFVPSGRRGSGVEAELWVTGAVAARTSAALTFALDADDAVRVRDVRDINAAQRVELERDVDLRRRQLVADEVIPFTDEQLRRALQNDSPPEKPGEPARN